MVKYNQSLKLFCRRLLQNIIIVFVRPYVVRELPGWGKLYAAIVGDYRRNWLWAGAQTKTIRGKMHGYLMHLNLSSWPDRLTYFLGRWYDLDMQLFINDLIRHGDTVVDVGAHRGDFALVASHLVGAEGKVICFEPNLKCLTLLEQEVVSNRIDNVIVYHFGLGEREEELEQNRYTLALSVSENSKAENAVPSDEKITDQVRVKIKRGDGFLANERVRLIKVDVEGFECNVIKGLVNTISRDHPIIVTEVWPQNLAACGFSVMDLVALMKRNGYEGYKLGLMKEKGRYTWQLSGFDTESNYDAVWMHRASNSDQVRVINSHMQIVSTVKRN